MARGSPSATPAWLSTYPSIDDMFDLDAALTFPAVNFPGADLPPSTSPKEAELPTATEAEVNDVVCSICTEGFKPGGEDGKRVPCGHVYHSDCITTWLSRCNCCPLCRAHVLVA